MSNFIRRASDAIHHRSRQGSADSTEAPKSPEAKEPPEQEPVNQNPESVQPESHVNESFPSIAAYNKAHQVPKERRRSWGWGHHEGNKAETKQQPSEPHEQKDNE